MDFLRLSKAKCELLPLGGERVDFVQKEHANISLLYVGTFYDRYIEKTIEGFALFNKQHPEINITYTIIGMGTSYEIKNIQNAIKNNAIEKKVTYVGEKRYEELHPYYHSHNIGVSYIPLTSYYDCQPPTKTYEYLLNGMIVLATPTSENKKVINQSNGILLKSDSTNDFMHGLEALSLSITNFDFENIHNEAQQYSWEQIVEQFLIPIIEKQ
jgi:glycosyltransferase involved in cell wall biosynthesis